MQNRAQVFVFKTDIRTRRVAQRLCKSLEKQGFATRATVDLADCDRVLRVVSHAQSSEGMSSWARALGIQVEEML